MTSLSFFFFFFQAEDGIRDTSVTGVQTCALPIWGGLSWLEAPAPRPGTPGPLTCTVASRWATTFRSAMRSEERRVGKECRARGAAEGEEKKTGMFGGQVDEKVDRVVANMLLSHPE